MKKIISYLCITLLVGLISPSCTRVVNPEMSSYQRKNMSKFAGNKRYKKGNKNGSRSHPAVKHKYGTIW